MDKIHTPLYQVSKVIYQIPVNKSGMAGAIFVITRHNPPFNCEALRRILGTPKGKENEMAHWVLNPNSNIVPRCTTRQLQTAKLHINTDKVKRKPSDQ